MGSVLGKWGQGKWGQCANLDRMQGGSFKKEDIATVGGKARVGYLGEDREYHQGRVGSFAAAVWQVQGVTWDKS